MIQDIYPEQMDIAYRMAEPAADSPVMHFRQGKITVVYDEKAEALRFPLFREYKSSPE